MLAIRYILLGSIVDATQLPTKLTQTAHSNLSFIFCYNLCSIIDRENYVLSTSNSRQRGDLKTKTRRIDTFFAKRG